MLGFVRRRQTFSSTIGTARLEVDLLKERLIYPDDVKVNESQTSNFSMPENFVVFECVHRLLTKGYQPRHIELEPKWKVGHGASGGRGDILIRDNAGKALLIIECKTAGREFERAWRRTAQDGGQLFSYAHQISEVQFLSLYSSDLIDREVRYRSHIISHRDNEKYLVANPHLKSFRNATDVPSRFGVWRDTYELDFTLGGIFENTIQPYHIGKDKYSVADLHPISASDQQKKYHEFATILRQHNVSGRENAFDKLVNLFLCKLVDETENTDDLKFFWKGIAYDTHFELLDRLQQLYQKGMGKFLGEDITYINENDVSNALRFVRQNPNATQRAVWHLFVKQKFFTNNDFSFIDVHNEKLFYQNAEVLLKLLQMWQGIRLIGDHQHNQFLGDMFEGFLDQGVKQSEGQYFTPGPICRFLLMSLPLETLVKSRPSPPKAIDYACGAGHFLTELAQQLTPLVRRHPPLKNSSEYHAAIYGVEKEYRLSKIAKVSAFMYGQPGINVCYGDALVSAHGAFPEIRDCTFDLLVANPPFSVRGFLETLSEGERNAYHLAETVDKLDTANAIEAFFLERAEQLLKPGGVAAIILPSSILSNGGTTYIRAREILLQKFDVVAIAEFGNGTFGKTGTNTIVLFLRRKATMPDATEHYYERVTEWFKGAENQKRQQVIYRDADLFERYAAHVGILAEDYKTLLCGTPNSALLAHEMFVAYRRAFDASTDVKSFRAKRKFRALTVPEQDAEMNKRFLAFAQAAERDKLLHFILADQQPNPVLILKGPTETKEQKKFLGYEWSAAKGGEGIKLIKNAQGRHLTPLYDEENRDNASKLNHFIAQNFAGALRSIPAELASYLSLVPLVDLLDFSRVTFEKQVALGARASIMSESKWPFVRLCDVAEIKNGGTPDTNLPEFWEGGNICWATLVDTKSKYLYDTQRKITQAGLKHSTLLPINTVIFSSRATIGEVCISKVQTATNQGYKSFICNPEKINYEYFYYLLLHLRKSFENLVPSGSKYKEINASTISDFRIPLPPLAQQDEIATECALVDSEVEEAQRKIEMTRRAIEGAVNAIYATSAPRIAIVNLSAKIQYGLSEAMNDGGIGYKIFRMNEIDNGRMVDSGAMKCVDIPAGEFSVYRLSRGDVLFNRTNSIEHVGKSGLFDLDGDYCFASYLVRVVPDSTKILPTFLAAMMNSTEFRTEAKGKAARSINQANINATTMKNMRVPVPLPPEQQRFVSLVMSFEVEITAARDVFVAASAKKADIMRKLL